MASRKSKVRKIIDDYSEGKNLKTFALGSGLVFITPSSRMVAAKDGGYYVHTYVTPPKGKPFWVGTCKAFRFNERDRCKHTDEFDEQIELMTEKIMEKEVKEKKKMMHEIKTGRKARTKSKKKGG